MYDPLFSQLEIAVLSTLGVVVLSENEVRGVREGSREGWAAAHQADPGPCPGAPGSVTSGASSPGRPCVAGLLPRLDLCCACQKKKITQWHKHVRCAKFSLRIVSQFYA